MECPKCDNRSDPNPDLSYTCSNCGFTFRPEEQEKKIVDKMIEKVNSLRSCIVTLSDSRTITLSFPKEMEPKATTRSWRAAIENEMSRITVKYFLQPITSIVFDDEV